MKDALFVALQYVLPQHGLSRLIGFLARCRWAPLKNLLVRAFAARFGVNMAEAEQPELTAYPDFNAFFTRPLRAGARPLAADPSALLCPADGAISQIGRITEAGLLQAKGHHYTPETLLGGDPSLAATFRNGHFATVYLSPKDYHRVHMPIAGTLTRTVYIPGQLFSVNDATAQRVPGLFARNERLACLFDTEAGPMAMILVGAMVVAGIETVWAGAVTPPRRALESRDFSRDPVTLGRGEEMGRFFLGSTVILLFAENRVTWPQTLAAGSAVRMGEDFGRWQPA